MKKTRGIEIDGYIVRQNYVFETREYYFTCKEILGAISYSSIEDIRRALYKKTADIETKNL
jgi:hypothetical protein